MVGAFLFQGGVLRRVHFIFICNLIFLVLIAWAANVTSSP